MLPSPFRIAAGGSRKRAATQQEGPSGRGKQAEASVAASGCTTADKAQPEAGSRQSEHSPSAAKSSPADRRPLLPLAAEENRAAHALPAQFESPVAPGAQCRQSAADSVRSPPRRLDEASDRDGSWRPTRRRARVLTSPESPDSGAGVSAAAAAPAHCGGMADHASDAEQQHARMSGAGTLDAFIMRHETSDSAHLADAEPEEVVTKADMPRKRPRATAWSGVRDRSCHRQQQAAASSLSREAMWRRYAEVATFQQCMPWNRALSAPTIMQWGFNQATLGHSGPIRTVQLDASGELLLSCQMGGYLAVHDVHTLRHRAMLNAEAREVEQAGCLNRSLEAHQEVNPTLLIYTGRRLEAARWAPHDPNLVAAAASSDARVQLFDLQYTQGEPKRTLDAGNMPEHLRGAQGVHGFSDVTFLGAGQYAIAAACVNGQIVLWDSRLSSSRPRAALTSPTPTGGITSLQADPEGHVIIAGTRSGEVVIWDVRGTVGVSAQLGSGSHASHPVVQRTNLWKAMIPSDTVREVDAAPFPGGHSQLHMYPVWCCVLDPTDSRRLAFTLGDRHTGVLDLTSQTVTHAAVAAYAAHPREPEPEDMEETDLTRLAAISRLPRPRKGAWAACAGSFLVPSLMLHDNMPPGVAVHDFGSCSPHVMPPEGLSTLSSCRTANVLVEVSNTACALTAHPATDEVFVGTGSGTLLILDTQSASNGEQLELCG